MKRDLDEAELAALARELAMNIRPEETILADYGLDKHQFEELSRNEFFRKAREQFTIEWNATGSTADRVKLQSLAGLEQLMPRLIGRAMMRDEPLPAATEVGKWLARNAGLGGEKTEARGPSDRFVITINLGADSEGKPIVEHYDKAIEAGQEDDPRARAIASLMRPFDKSSGEE